MGLKVKDPNGEWRSTGGGGGGKSNLLVVTVSSETGEWVSSHTYQEIKAIVDGGGEAVLRMNYGGQQFTQYELLGVNDDHATFRNYQIGTGLIVVSYYYINSDGTVTYDLQYVAIPSDDHINELINTALGEVESSLLVVTADDENGTTVSSHTYQEIKEFAENGGTVVFREGSGDYLSLCALQYIDATQASFSRYGLTPQGGISVTHNVRADGTVTYDMQYWTIPNDDHINGLIDAYMEEALGGDY